LHVLNSGHFAFSGVSGFSGLILTYLLRSEPLSSHRLGTFRHADERCAEQMRLL
jgi:hypothetical protein